MITAIVVKALEVIAAALPGFLALFSGQGSDAAAIEHAQHILDTVPLRKGPKGTWTLKVAEAKKRP